MHARLLSLSLSVALALGSVLVLGAPLTTEASYLPGETLDPSCLPTDSTCVVTSLTASSTANSFPYYAANGSVLSATTTLTLLTSGNFGIGTTSPYAKLTVWGGGTGTRYAFEIANSASTTIVRFLDNGTGYFLGNVGIGTTSPYAKLSVVGETVSSYFTATSTTATSTFNGGAVFATSGGNVGIRTASPSFPLDVNGIIGVTGIQAINIPNQSIFSKSMYLGNGGTSATTSTASNPVDPMEAESNGSYNGLYNTLVGINAGLSITAANQSVFVGTDAGRFCTVCDQDTMVGFQAGMNTTNGYHNTFIGDFAGYYNTTGYFNTYIGTDVTGGATGYNNTAVGASTASVVVGHDNTFFGVDVGVALTSGNYNSLLGSYAGRNMITSNNNTAVGTFSLYTATSSVDNTAIGYDAMFNSSSDKNTAVGSYSLYYATSSANNTAVGYQALLSAAYGSDVNHTGSYNVAVGTRSIGGGLSGTYPSVMTGNYNTALGYQALWYNTTGYFNTANGGSSLYSNTTGYNNTATGYNSIFSNTTGHGNTANGRNTLYNNISATSSTAVGFYAAQGAAAYSNQGGVYLGYQSGYSAATGSDYNTLIGYQSGYGVTTGARNVFIGNSTLAVSYNQVTTGSNNISIGNNVAVASSTASNQLNIGNLIYGTELNGTGSSLSTGSIGIGTSTPYARLTVWGTDTASTSPFTVANSASTTVFAVYNNGNATYSGLIFQSSDQRLKTNITPLDASSSLDAILGLTPVSYTRLDQSDLGTNLGFIAQDVQQIFPNLVSTSSPTALTPDGTLTLNYVGLIAPIVEAIKALAVEVRNFARSITTAVVNATTGNFTNVNTDNLCIKKSDGSNICITGDELGSLLDKEGTPPELPADTPPVVVADVDVIATSTDTTDTIVPTDSPASTTPSS